MFGNVFCFWEPLLLQACVCYWVCSLTLGTPNKSNGGDTALHRLIR